MSERKWRLRSRGLHLGDVRRRVPWPRVAAAGGALALGGWVVGTLGWYAWLRGVEGAKAVRYVDLALYPWRADKHRTALVEHHFERGREALGAGRFAEGERQLRRALALAPGNLGARQLLVQAQLRYGQTDVALQTLADPGSLAQADREHFEFTFRWLHELEQDELIQNLGKRLLPGTPERTEENAFVALQLARSRYERCDYAAARKLIDEWSLAGRAEGVILLARCDWESVSPDAAIARLTAEVDRLPGTEAAMYLVKLLLARGDLVEAQARALALRQGHPRLAPARIDLLRVYHRTERQAELEREADAYLRDFAQQEAALKLLAEFAQETARVELAQHVRRVAGKHELPLKHFDRLGVEAALEAREWRTAAELAFAAIGRVEAGDDRQSAMLTGLRAVGLFGAGETEEGRRVLDSLGRWRGLRGDEAVAIARWLARAGASDPAHDLLGQVAQMEPGNRAAAVELVKLNVERGDRAGVREFLPRLLRSRKPSRALLTAALGQLNSPAEDALAAQVEGILKTLPPSVAP